MVQNRKIAPADIVAFIVCTGFSLSPYYTDIFISDNEPSFFDTTVHIIFAPHILLFGLIDYIFPSIHHSGYALKMTVLFLAGIPASYLYGIILVKVGKKLNSVFTNN